MAPSSRAVATFIPLLMADWVWFNWPWVADRYCSATNAPPLVLTLKVIRSLRSGFARRAFCPLALKASAVPDCGKMLLGIVFGRRGKNATAENVPGALSARQQLPHSVKFAGMR